MNHQCQMSLPEVWLCLVCRLYMNNQRARAKMDPRKTSPTQTHRAGLSSISELAWAAGAVVLSGGSEDNRLINDLNRKIVYILNICKNPSHYIGCEYKLGFISIGQLFSS